MYHPFSIAETIQSAWSIIKKNYISLLVYSVISLICYEVIQVFFGFIFYSDNPYSLLANVLLAMLVQSYLALSFYKLILTLMDREYYEFEFKDIIPSLRMALSFVTIGALYVILIATIMFVNGYLVTNETLKGILDKVEKIAIGYLLVRSIFCLCFIVDEDSGPIESLRQSFTITRNNFFKLLALIVMVIVFIALLLAIITMAITVLFDTERSSYIISIAGIGWFAISFPVVQVMIMTTYRKLVYSTKDLDDDVSETL